LANIDTNIENLNYGLYTLKKLEMELSKLEKSIETFDKTRVQN